MRKVGVDIAVLIFFILFAGILSIALGQDTNWDLANYHLYNPYAFLTGRTEFDIFPAGLQTYLNPLLDLPFYFMAGHFNENSRLVGFLQGQYYAIAAFLLYKIADIFFIKQGKEKLWLLLFSLSLGLSGAFMIFEIGTTSNDIQPAILVLGAVYLHLKYLFAKCSAKRTMMLFAAGALLGMGAGFKLTCALFVAAEFMVLCLMHRKYRSPLEIIFYNLLGVVVGFLITNGYWMWFLYTKFANPFFPFYNDIFRSIEVVPERFDDMRYMPATPMQLLFYPFYWNGLERNFVFEHIVRDLRYVLVYISVFVIAFTNTGKKYFDRRKELFLIIFITSAYVVWLNKFCILRYMLAVECLSGLIIMTAIIHLKSYLKSPKAYVTIVAATALTVLSTTVYTTWDRKPYSYKLFDIPNLGFPDNAVVLLQEGFPSAVWIPFQNPKARFINIPREDLMSTNSYFQISDYTKSRIKNLIKSNKNNIYVLYSYYDIHGSELNSLKEYIDTDKLSCKFVRNNFKKPSQYRIYTKVCH